MKKNNIEKTKDILASDMKYYVQIILKEFGNNISEERKVFLQSIDDYNSRIAVEDSGTISMYATDWEVIMPYGAYKIFRFMRFIPGYGVNKKHKSYKEGEIINKNTYFDYIKHVFISGMNEEEFFRDTLLHETMHFCGADGTKAIKEGLTELKTRELAEKYGLKASRCGYPKEVDIANKIQSIIGKDIADKITFARNDKEIYKLLQENCGTDSAEMFFNISYLMDKELQEKYDHSKFGGIFGPIKKAIAYSNIDYSKVYDLLEKIELEKSIRKNTSNTFISEIREKNKEVGVLEENNKFKTNICEKDYR